MTCPNCGSGKVRRGGMLLWQIYLVLIVLALIAVLGFGLNAAIVGGIMIAAVVLANLILNQWTCRDCGHQWRAAR